MAHVLDRFGKLIIIGVGISRRELTEQTGQLSPLVHSFDTFDRYMGICKEFINYCKATGANKLHKIGSPTVDGFLMVKIGKGYTNNTIETNMCALQKFFFDSSRPDLVEFLAITYPIYKYFGAPWGYDSQL